jgi:hypothetical protein
MYVLGVMETLVSYHKLWYQFTVKELFLKYY